MKKPTTKMLIEFEGDLEQDFAMEVLSYVNDVLVPKYIKRSRDSGASFDVRKISAFTGESHLFDQLVADIAEVARNHPQAKIQVEEHDGYESHSVIVNTDDKTTKSGGQKKDTGRNDADDEIVDIFKKGK